MASEFEQYKFPVKYDEQSYIDMVVGLLPKGIIWGVESLSFAVQWLDSIISATEYQDAISAGTEIQDTTEDAESGSKLGLLLSCLGSELARIEADAWDVLNSTDPGVAEGATLEHWESVLGLPTSCTPTTATVEDRQRLAHVRRFEANQVPTNTAFEQAAESLGFVATVTGPDPIWYGARCGVARCGVNRCTADFPAAVSILRVVVTDGLGDIEILKCAFNQLKQAHVKINWIDER